MSIFEFYQLEISYMLLLFEFIGTIVLIITIIYYFQQLRLMQDQLIGTRMNSDSQIRMMQEQIHETRKSSTSQNLLTLINFLQSEDVREARTHVIESLRFINFYEWSPEDKRAASKVASSYGCAGVILKHKSVPINPIIEGWGDSITKSFEALKPYINELRKEAGTEYWIAFDWLYEQVIIQEKIES